MAENIKMDEKDLKKLGITTMTFNHWVFGIMGAVILMFLTNYIFFHFVPLEGNVRYVAYAVAGWIGFGMGLKRVNKDKKVV